jgi:superfamily II DNA/RNA helicase
MAERAQEHSRAGKLAKVAGKAKAAAEAAAEDDAGDAVPAPPARAKVANPFAGLADSSGSEASDSEEVGAAAGASASAARAVTGAGPASTASSEASDSEEAAVASGGDASGGDASGDEQEESEETEYGDLSHFPGLVGLDTRSGSSVPESLVLALERMTGSERATDVQREVWSALLSDLSWGRDVIAISKTGSGKTLAFLVPVLCELAGAAPAALSAAQAAAPSLVFPLAVALAPTRELAQQSHEVASTLIAACGADLAFRAAAVLGGQAWGEQVAALLEARPRLLVATLGRFLSLCGLAVESNVARAVDAGGAVATSPAALAQAQAQAQREAAEAARLETHVSLRFVRSLVLDEADRMLDMGFARDLEALAGLLNGAALRRQRAADEADAIADGADPAALRLRLVLTSATWAESTAQALQRLFLSRTDAAPVLIRVEDAGATLTRSVTQRVEVLASRGAPRLKRLLELLHGILDQQPPKAGKQPAEQQHQQPLVIVFVVFKEEARSLGKELAADSISCAVLQGDMTLARRKEEMARFRAGGDTRVLVATDVAGRGIDVAGVTDVVNYSLGISLQNFIHRCGRTGRAGRFGTAHTFVVKGLDDKLTPELVALLDQARQQVPQDLKILAAQVLKARAKKSKAEGAAGRGAAGFAAPEPPRGRGPAAPAAALPPPPLSEEQELRRENAERVRLLQQQRQAKGRPAGSKAKRGHGHGKKG